METEILKKKMLPIVALVATKTAILYAGERGGERKASALL
jgi:hypothetical protein